MFLDKEEKKYTLLSDPTKNHHQMSYHCHALVYSYSWLYNLVLHLAMWVDTGITEHECGWAAETRSSFTGHYRVEEPQLRISSSWSWEGPTLN